MAIVRSLRAQSALWLGAGALGCCLLALALEASLQYRALAERQDRRLVAALHRAAAQHPPVWRVNGLDGRYVAGSRTLAGPPASDGLRPGQPLLYLTHDRGRLLRAAATLVPGDKDGPLLLQLAEPAADRLPTLAGLASGRLLGFLAGVASMALLAAGGAAAGRRWLLRALEDPRGGGAQPVTAPPRELQAALAEMRGLAAQQRQWVDEQRRFLADAAHQLRTPMAVLRTQLQSAQLSDADPRPVLGEMLHTVDRATGLANQLLSLTRVEQLKRSGHLQPVAVAEAAREAVVELSPLIGQRRLGFALEGEGFEAPADAVMLGELLRNLLANAIHHSPAGSCIGVVTRAVPGARELVVWDEGAGVDDELKPRLFTPFSAGKGGFGLGLSICQQIADAMGATVRLHNRVDGGRVVGVDAVLRWPAA